MNQEEKSQQFTAPNFNQLELEVLKFWEENHNQIKQALIRLIE